MTDERIKIVVDHLKNQGALTVKIFGSHARGEETPESDLDVLVEFSARKSLLELVKIEQDLEELLGIKVDLLTRKSISPYLIEQIENESVQVM
jgi:uncharacterized protein